MGIIRDYASTFYEWLKETSGVDVFREPIVFDDDHPQPEEYITYSADVGNFKQEMIQSVTIYSKSTGWNHVMDIVDKIEETITEHGTLIQKEWGNMVIEKGSPFYQDKPDEDASIRAGYINFLVTIYQKYV